MPILEIDALTRRFGDFTAVDGLTLAVEAGEVLLIFAKLYDVPRPERASKIRDALTFMTSTMWRTSWCATTRADDPAPRDRTIDAASAPRPVPRRADSRPGSALFSTLSLLIAVVVKTRERFMGIGGVLTMPLFFASNAIYPLDIMPRWLQLAAHLNPLTYEVDALRTLMLAGGASLYGLAVDFGVLVAALTILVMIGARAYPRVVT